MLIPGLIAVWAIAIAWYALSGRQSGADSSFSSVRSFGSRPSGLGYATASPYGRSSVSLRTYRVAERRRNVLLSLASATVLAVLLALLTGSVVLWLAFFVAASLLGAYMYVLAQIRAAAAARRPVLQNVYVLDDHRRDDSIGDDRIAL
jgi:hypothetical protein